MSYRIKEMVCTLQGEGFNTGSAVVLCRFEGCNMSCSFCDTDFIGTDGPGGGEFDSAAGLAGAAELCWMGGSRNRSILCTGGEPLLQLDEDLLEAFHERGFRVLLETNGSLPSIPGIDWTCVSPKDGAMPVIRSGDELKLPYPQQDVDPDNYIDLDFSHFYLQPIDGMEFRQNLRKAVSYCLENPRWKLSLQVHKYIGMP